MELYVFHRYICNASHKPFGWRQFLFRITRFSLHFHDFLNYNPLNDTSDYKDNCLD